MLFIALLGASLFGLGIGAAELAKETHADHAYLVDLNGDVVRTGPALFHLPLYAAPAMGFDMLKRTVAVDLTLPENGATVKVSYHVMEVKWSASARAFPLRRRPLAITAPLART